MPITGNYEFTKLNLNREEFDNLIFMGNPREWEDHPHDPSHKFLLDICYNQLKDVVQKVINKSENIAKSAVEVFKGLRHIRIKGEDRPWFERHLILAENFDKSLMTRLWVRNRTDGGKEQESGGNFYIQDGNHRALVYAVRVECGEENYDDVEVLHATSWDIAMGILEYHIQSAHELHNKGIFNKGQRRAVEVDEKIPDNIKFFE